MYGSMLVGIQLTVMNVILNYLVRLQNKELKMKCLFRITLVV